MIPNISLKNYSYLLPNDRIAKYPLANRDNSKILIFAKKMVSESKFLNLAQLLPNNSLMVFNKTKVVPARLLFKKLTGANIEIFCLEPYSPSEYNNSFSAVKECLWRAVVGNAKRWREGYIYFNHSGDSNVASINLRASLIKREENSAIVKFEWDSEDSFAMVIDICGRIPIPPYLNREANEEDRERYQTLYASVKGSVAAPTAGLHFSKRVLEQIEFKGIIMESVVLHVGAGTFAPIKSTHIAHHTMHSEPFFLSKPFIEKLYIHIKAKRPVIAVGTTSLRTLESIYWLGNRCYRGEEPTNVAQWEPYLEEGEISLELSLKALIEWMESTNSLHLERKTDIIIVPGYKFRVVDILITNFHQPDSTLLLLIAAFIGDSWREVYNYALNNDFRFLSYGDSSILFRGD